MASQRKLDRQSEAGERGGIMNEAKLASGCTGPSECSLPPLPKKKVIHRVMPDDYRYGDVMGYTAKQMIEYAKLCLAANAESEASQ
jgi:hypothetical protein